MKIAVPTDDGKTISQHFGRARSFAIFEVESGEITSKQLIESNTPHSGSHSGQGHGAGGWFMPALQGCEVIIATSMGRRAISYFEEAGIKPVFTDLTDAEEAVKAYSAGTLKSLGRPDCRPR
ncbi:iron-molybdenum cofactor biosynthesis protein [candidate division TA06 bacterium B3_TA06]|uniref:Iron-molybdenum cofactor biosynthesis protein n=1 Tax=candidate division TA06 bacterium B3_TA06 TaxID=2012487 RepID=A0A532V6L6_UNCT6|nr:MAG: iron-molybdenum cofactor biosynthesis protein [candidate division TA06 bacterium B3_TA06]